VPLLKIAFESSSWSPGIVGTGKFEIVLPQTCGRYACFSAGYASLASLLQFPTPRNTIPHLHCLPQVMSQELFDDLLSRREPVITPPGSPSSSSSSDTESRTSKRPRSRAVTARPPSSSVSTNTKTVTGRKRKASPLDGLDEEAKKRRRREQNREAAAASRARKAAYIASLEEQVRQLTAKQRQLEAQVAALLEENLRLRSLASSTATSEAPAPARPRQELPTNVAAGANGGKQSDSAVVASSLPRKSLSSNALVSMFWLFLSVLALGASAQQAPSPSCPACPRSPQSPSSSNSPSFRPSRPCQSWPPLAAGTRWTLPPQPPSPTLSHSLWRQLAHSPTCPPPLSRTSRSTLSYSEQDWSEWGNWGRIGALGRLVVDHGWSTRGPVEALVCG